MIEPDRLTRGVTTGRAFIPYVGDSPLDDSDGAGAATRCALRCSSRGS